MSDNRLSREARAAAVSPQAKAARRPAVRDGKPVSWTMLVGVQPSGGARRDRTDDLMLAKHALSQLSYGPMLVLCAALAALRRIGAGGRSALRSPAGFGANPDRQGRRRSRRKRERAPEPMRGKRAGRRT